MNRAGMLVLALVLLSAAGLGLVFLAAERANPRAPVAPAAPLVPTAPAEVKPPEAEAAEAKKRPGE
jgi:hypothetical protein